MAKNTTLLDLMFGKKKLVKYKPPKKQNKVKNNTKTKSNDVQQKSNAQQKSKVHTNKKIEAETKKKTPPQRKERNNTKLTINEKTKKADVFGVGVVRGGLQALIPVGKGLDNDLEKTKYKGAYNAGKVTGNVVATAGALGVAGASTGVKKGAEKLATNKLGKKATEKLVTTKGVQAIAKKSLKSAGKEATEKAVKAESEKVAKGLVKGATKDLLMDATAGVAINNNLAINDGKKIGSKEWAKEMAVNSALDLGIGGAINAMPVVKGGVKALKNTKKVARLDTNGKVKYVKEALPQKKTVSVKAPKSVKQYKANLPQTYKVKKANSRNTLKAKQTEAVSTKAELPNGVAKSSNNGSYTNVLEERDVAKKAFEDAYNKALRWLNYINDNPNKQERMQTAKELVDNEVRRIRETGKTSERWASTLKDTLMRYDTLEEQVSAISKNATELSKSKQTLKTPKAEPIPKAVEYADVRTANEGATYNDYLQKKETVGKSFDDLYEQEIKQIEDYVRNYEPKGVDYNFRYDRSDPNARDFNRGYTSRTSNNDKWYQDFWRKNGRKPNKGEARQIAESIINEQLDHISRGGINNGEFPVSDELEALLKEYNNLDDQVKAMEKAGYADSIFTSKEVPEVGEMYKDVPAPEPIPDEVNAIGARAMPDNSPEANAIKYGEVEGVPNATAYGDTTKGAQTVVKGNLADDTTKDLVMQGVYEGDFAKYSKSNRVALQNAQIKVNDNLEQAYNDFSAIVRNDRQARSEDIATGYKLVERFQQLGQEAKANGDLQTYNDCYEKVIDVIKDVCIMESESARTLQAMRLFNSLSYMGREKVVVNAVERIKKLTGAEDVSIKPELLDNLRNADTEETLAKAKKDIITDVWNQIPPTWTQKANAWRYLAMLGNPKTHIRNVLGNALFVPIKGMRNVLATGLEKAIIKDGNRTKAILTRSDKDLIQLGKDDFDLVKGYISGGSRYIEGARNFDAKQFKSKTLNKAYETNSKLLEKEDELFMGIAYRRAYAQYLKANGAKGATELSQEILDGAREYATKEALNSTYRDVSTLADMISQVKKFASMETSAIPVKDYADPKTVRRAQLAKKGAGMVVEATMPFTKTPINILRRGVDYSPVGLAKGIYNIASAKGNTDELVKGIEYLASGLTGTGIMAIGYYMGDCGLAQGSLDVMSDEGSYKQLMGEQAYSIRVNGYSYTMDWAVPSAMAFFVGANLANEMSEEGVPLETALNVLSQISDPVFNLSMLSGINTVLGDTASSFKSTNAMVQTLENTIKSYLGQYVPTIGGQIARTITPYKKSATATEETAFGRQAHNFLNQQENKIPFLNLRNADYVDAWGNRQPTEWNGLFDNPIVQNFISAGTLRKLKTSEVDREIQRLGEQLPSSEFGSITPKYTSSKDFTQEFRDKGYRMTEKQLQQFKTTRGQQSYKLLRELFNTESYRNMTADEKKSAISDCYSQAKELAVREFLKENGVSERAYVRSKLTDNQAKAFDKSKMTVEKYDKLKSVKNSFTKNTSDLEKAYTLYNAGATRTELEVMGSKVSDHRMETIKNIGTNISLTDYENAMAYREQDENGRLSRDEIIEYLESTDLSQAEKYYMYNALASWRNAYKRNPY